MFIITIYTERNKRCMYMYLYINNVRIPITRAVIETLREIKSKIQLNGTVIKIHEMLTFSRMRCARPSHFPQQICSETIYCILNLILFKLRVILAVYKGIKIGT